jgi:hypothetical protein
MPPSHAYNLQRLVARPLPPPPHTIRTTRTPLRPTPNDHHRRLRHHLPQTPCQSRPPLRRPRHPHPILPLRMPPAGPTIPDLLARTPPTHRPCHRLPHRLHPLRQLRQKNHHSRHLSHPPKSHRLCLLKNTTHNHPPQLPSLAGPHPAGRATRNPPLLPPTTQHTPYSPSTHPERRPPLLAPCYLLLVTCSLPSAPGSARTSPIPHIPPFAPCSLPLAPCHLSLATCHLPLVTCHLSLVTCSFPRPRSAPQTNKTPHPPYPIHKQHKTKHNQKKHLHTPSPNHPQHPPLPPPPDPLHEAIHVGDLPQHPPLPPPPDPTTHLPPQPQPLTNNQGD